MAQWTDLQWIEKLINRMRLCATCEKSRGLQLAESSLTAGWLAGKQMKFGRGLLY